MTIVHSEHAKHSPDVKACSFQTTKHPQSVADHPPQFDQVFLSLKQTHYSFALPQRLVRMNPEVSTTTQRSSLPWHPMFRHPKSIDHQNPIRAQERLSTLKN